MLLRECLGYYRRPGYRYRPGWEVRKGKIMKQYLPNLFVLALSIAFLWHFSNIAIRGSHYIEEPNILILSAEIVMMLGLIFFATYNIVSQLRGK